MSKSNAAETDLLELVFNATSWPNLADNTATSPAANITVALHTGDPGEGGTQLTSEATYTGYGRVNVVRTSGGWTVSGDTASNVAAITFGACTAGSNTITHFSLGTGTSDYLIYSGALTGSLAVSSGITPEFAIGNCTVTED